VIPVVLAVSALALVLGLLNLVAGSADDQPAIATRTVSVAAARTERPIPPGFLGLSLEYSAVPKYAGTDPARVDPVFVQLIRNLTPGQRPVLRIGGDSSDWTWWPVPGLTRPPGVTYTLDQNWLGVTHALTSALRARLLLGLNLEANSTAVASTELSTLRTRLGPGSVQAFELGNEPELYGLFPWYRTAGGRGVPGRPPTYAFEAFLSDFTRFAATLPPAPLAGPTTGGTGFVSKLGRFLSAEPRVDLVTIHHYPLQLCFSARSSPRFPSIPHLLSDTASAGLAAGFAPAIATARARGLAVRVDELNSVSCGAARAVSQTFASALWALDALFELAHAGAGGVNIHTFPGAGYELFRVRRSAGRWQAAVAPEYYGLMMFAIAAPVGSRLLPGTTEQRGPVKVWATLGRDRRIRVVMINKDADRPAEVDVRAAAGRGTATLARLEAPSLSAATGVTLAGRSFGGWSATGRLTGAPQVSALVPNSGRYAVQVPAASAALLTLPASP
jgi:hypothetical protein